MMCSLDKSNSFIRGCFNQSMDSSFIQSNCGLRIGSNIEPSNKQGFDILNPHIYDGMYPSDFKKVGCAYQSKDPRLYNAVRAQHIILDRPPIDGTVLPKDVYSPNLNLYGQRYNTYSDINAGQVMYYTDKSTQDPYFTPVFGNNANV